MNIGVYYMYIEVDKKYLKKDFCLIEFKSGNRLFFVGFYFSLNKE